MRYAIFSDVHANQQAWEAVLADALSQGADTLVCLGDVVGYGPRPLEVLRAVREVTPNFVLGNHDAAACGRLDPSIFNERARAVIEWTRERLDDEALSFLMQVPLQMGGAGIQFVHAEVRQPGEFGYVDGVGPAELNLAAMTEPLGFLGHTHLPMAYAMPRRGGQVTQLPPIDFEVERSKRYLINVGSVGEPRTTDVRASYVIYDDAKKTVSFRKVAFDVEAYVGDLDATGLDIRPYFVQVVEAGKVAGAPEPAVAPQLALAQLPKVAEGVAGQQGRLVVGTSHAHLQTGPVPAVMAPPKSSAPLLIGLVAALVLVVGGVAMVVMKKKAEVAGGAAPGGGTRLEVDEAPAGGGGAAVNPLTVQPASLAESNDAVPIKGLKVRLFTRAFQNLEELRVADKNGESAGEAEVPDGLLRLAHAREAEAFGLVWEGSLLVPETAEYEFTLEAGAGAALLLYWSVEVEVEGRAEGAPAKTHTALLRKGQAPFRVEYISGGESPGMSLSWRGPGLEGAPSLVGSGAGADIALVAKVPQEGEPESAPPEVKRMAPAKLSEDLLAYWSFDSREPKQSRFEKWDNGMVIENLIMEKGQPVRYLVPDDDPGSRWTGPQYDATGWKEGMNGVGYERQPGAFQEFLGTTIASEGGGYPHSVYVRIPFEVDDPGAYDALLLFMRYDDGFVAYLNGRQFTSSADYAPPPQDLRWNSGATREKKNKAAVEQEKFTVNPKRLQKGTNLLAVHALNWGGEPNATNTGSTGDDFLILPSLVARLKDSTLPEVTKPGGPNKHDRAVEQEQLKGEVVAVAGRHREAYQFAQEGSIEIGAKDEYAIGERSFTLSMWFTRDPGSLDNQARRLVSAGAGGDQKPGWALWMTRKGDGLTFAIGNGRSRVSTTAKNASLANGEWRHVAVTVDRENQVVFIFIDGMLVSDGRVTLLNDGPIESNSGLSIGKNSDDEQHHRGKLDDLALWRRVLLPEEIEKIFQSGTGLGEIFDGEE